MISDEYRRLNRKLHDTNPLYGSSGGKRVADVMQLVRDLNAYDILDYGCGKGTLKQFMPVPVKEYDPAIIGKDTRPSQAQLVVCTDVLEHVEPEWLDTVIGDIAHLSKVAAYIIVHTGEAKKFLEDGRNAHLTQEPGSWWMEKLKPHFYEIEMEETQTEAIFRCQKSPLC